MSGGVVYVLAASGPFDGGTINLLSTSVIDWNGDTGISRGNAGEIHFGNGTPTDSSADLVASAISLGTQSTPRTALDATTSNDGTYGGCLIQNTNTAQYSAFSVFNDNATVNVQCGVYNSGNGNAGKSFLFISGVDAASFSIYVGSPWLTLTSAGALQLQAYATAGVLVNDASGNVTTNTAVAAATISAAFIADHRLAVNIAGTTVYLAASTTAW